MLASIILYTQPECPPCNIIKLFFNDRGVRYEERNLASNPLFKEELQIKWESLSTPTIIVENEVIRGFDIDRLNELLNKHNL
ncbi:glutaredoxin family protein [Bacillus sp. FJAT-42315]|uniref:glutaredoxin family protein n=1 Tax=Bacillus sp. FJAT-42315 TaxID=2014077 RepID=UPI000C24A72E|nr:glutaredoxin family protein [Bacillus sp. FJAT-42315]